MSTKEGSTESSLPELWAHQKKAIEFFKTHNEMALFMDPGVGKTRTVLESVRWLYNEKRKVLNTLIVAPLIVVENWKREIKLYTKIPDAKVHTLSGTIEEKASELLTLEGIVIVNYDVFTRDAFMLAALRWGAKVMILDESHRAKTYNAKRTKNLMKVSLGMGKDAYRILMTGTPIPNDETDLWSQFFILDHGETFGPNFFGFRAYYFMNLNASKPKDGRYYPLWVARPGIRDLIKEKINSKTIIAKKEECLDLPELVVQEVDVELSNEQKKVYLEMKKDLIAFVHDKHTGEDKASVATIALTKMMRMQQIISGFLKMEDGSIANFDNPRARVLAELLGDICGAHKVIVWAVFHEDYATVRRVCKELKLEYVEVHGGIASGAKYDAIERFQKDDLCRVFIGSPAAGGIGINLVEASYSIWYSRNYSYEQDEQATARNYRGGSERHPKITRIDLVTRRTVDELILKTVREKKKLSDEILNIDTEAF